MEAPLVSEEGVELVNDDKPEARDGAPTFAVRFTRRASSDSGVMRSTPPGERSRASFLDAEHIGMPAVDGDINGAAEVLDPAGLVVDEGARKGPT